jgi:DNA-binding transcriptional LysR family regulator
MHSIALRYLDEVARQGSFRKAGAVLNVTASALNRQILKIEAELGLRLFERKPDGIELTVAGKLLLEHARQTLTSYEHVRAKLGDLRQMKAGQLTVSCVDSLAFDLMPDIVSAYLDKYPNITFTVRSDPADMVLQSLEDEHVDVGFTFSHFTHPDVRMLYDIPAQFGAVIAPDHPLAGKSEVTLEECLEYPLVRTFSPTGRHTFVENEARDRGLTVSASFYTNSMVMAKKAIQANVGIGIYMRLGVISDIAAGNLAFVPLIGSSLSGYRIGMFVSAKIAMNEIDRTFVDISKTVMKRYA